MQPKQKKKIQYPAIRLIELLAINKTADTRQLLKKHNKQDAINYEDLEKKLIDLYKTTDDKLALEKEMAELHPHKDFILKYCAPATNTSVHAEDVTVQNIPKSEVNQANVPAEYLNATGAKQYSCACGCGGYHGFSGPSQTPQAREQQIFLTVFGITAIALVGLFIYKHHHQ